jgi:hypothetical protein
VSFSAIAWALEQGRSRSLPTAERMLLVALANALNDKTGRCDPGQAVLHAETGLTERHIRDLVVSLARRGLLQFIKVGRALHYRLLREIAASHGAVKPEPSSDVTETIQELGSAIVDTTQEPSSSNGKDDSGTWTPRYRNPVPTIPEPSSAKPIRETRETKEPPVAPHRVGGGATRADFSNPRALGTNPRGPRTKPSGNAFSDMRRALAAAHNVITIDASAEEVADFQAFHQQLRRVANG